jgi:hypothetical protein
MKWFRSKRKPVVFQYNLAQFNVETVGVLAAGMAYGSTRHPNALIKKIALEFIQDLTARVDAVPSHYLKINFADFSLQNVVELGVALHFLMTNPQSPAVMNMLEGLADAVLAEVRRRRNDNTPLENPATAAN